MAKKVSQEYVAGYKAGMKVGKRQEPEFVRGFNAGRKTAAMLAIVSKPGRKPAETPTKRRGRRADMADARASGA